MRTIPMKKAVTPSESAFFVSRGTAFQLLSGILGWSGDVLRHFDAGY